MVTDKTAHDALVSAFVKAWYGIGKDEATRDDHEVADAILDDLRGQGYRVTPAGYTSAQVNAVYKAVGNLAVELGKPREWFWEAIDRALTEADRDE